MSLLDLAHSSQGGSCYKWTPGEMAPSSPFKGLHQLPLLTPQLSEKPPPAPSPGGGGGHQLPCLKITADMNPTRPHSPNENYLPTYGTRCSASAPFLSCPLSECAVTCLGHVHRAGWVVDYRGALLSQEQRHAQRASTSRNKAGRGRAGLRSRENSSGLQEPRPARDIKQIRARCYYCTRIRASPSQRKPGLLLI